MDKAKRNSLDTVQNNVKDLMDHAIKGLNNIQSDPIGANFRGDKADKINYKDLMSLGPEKRNEILAEQFRISGHKGVEYDGCDTCKFLEKNMRDK